MMVRQRRFRIGQRVKLHDLSTEGAGNAYPLPPGWSHGEEVTVIGFDHGWATVTGEGGKQARVFIVNIDSGWDEQYAPGNAPAQQPTQIRASAAVNSHSDVFTDVAQLCASHPRPASRYRAHPRVAGVRPFITMN